MKREDLGKMLEANLGWPVIQGGMPSDYRMMFDIELQRGAEYFWDDVIDALTVTVATDPSININQSDLMVWLKDQKFGGPDE